jgi:hypothetical protein
MIFCLSFIHIFNYLAWKNACQILKKYTFYSTFRSEKSSASAISRAASAASRDGSTTSRGLKRQGAILLSNGKSGQHKSVAPLALVPSPSVLTPRQAVAEKELKRMSVVPDNMSESDEEAVRPHWLHT